VLPLPCSEGEQASIKTGTVTASLILSKLANYPRQNGLAKALSLRFY